MNKKIAASIMSLLMIAMAMPVMAVDTNPAVVTGSVVVGTCPVGTIGLNTDVGVLNFGALSPLQASNIQNVELTITPTGYNGLECQGDDSTAPDYVAVTVTAVNWIGATSTIEVPVEMIAGSTSIDGAITDFDTVTELSTSVSSTLSFIVKPPEIVTPDTYTQTITISAIY